MNEFLAGNKIYLREMRDSDISQWYQWFNDPSVTQHMNKGIFPNSKLLQEEHYRSLSKTKNDIQLAIISKESDALIGTIGIHKIDWVHCNGDVSVMISKPSDMGKGIATEAISMLVRHAFTKMNLHRLTSGMVETNVSCRRCFEKNGFVLEGTRRKHFFYEGSYVDVHIFGLLREEWENEHNGGEN